MARHSSLRAADADRDAVADRLRRATLEGRLEPDELEERLDAAFRARTYGELDALVRDLPGTPVARPRAQTVPVARTAFVLAVRVAAVLAIVGVVMVALALTAAWWIIAALVWLTIRTARGACPRHRTTWQRPPHARRV
jgi:Domain of unknown function (DUF1707)